MKIVRFLYQGNSTFGFLENDKIFIAKGESLFELIKTNEVILLSDVEVLPPLTPNKFIAVGLNYKKHALEVNKPVPEEPMLFMISPTSVIATNQSIKIRHSEHLTEHEGELAIIIGKECRNISLEEADDYIFGYTICNDVSDRVLQRKDTQFTRAKSFDTYKPLGPYVVTGIDSSNLKITVKVNDEIRQSSTTADMIFSPQKIVSFLSHTFPLEPGDVIITGTPEGVSSLKGGDVVEVSIENIGNLVNYVN